MDVCLDLERLDDCDHTQRRYDVVDKVDGEHGEPVGGRFDSTDDLAVFSTRRSLFDRQSDKRAEEKRHSERRDIREHEPVQHRAHHL